MRRDLFLFAGEPSGDELGKGILSAIKKKAPSLNFYGVGGKKMREEGLIPLMHMEEFSVMGFLPVLKAIFPLISKFKKIKENLLTFPPKAVLLIDYPVFNMLLAKGLRKGGYKGKIIHYVAPTVWAWKKKRAYKMAKTHDLLLSILPFEKHYFSKTSLDVRYVGHPLVAMINSHRHQSSWKPEKHKDKKIIGIFPGSRHEEIVQNLPLQLQIAQSLLNKHPNHVIAISLADEKWIPLIQTFLTPSFPTFFVTRDYRYELMKESSIALATSGTATLELALFETPTVVFYHLTHINYYLVRHFFRIRLPFISLANLICNREIFPEFVHRKLSINEIYYEAEKFLINPAARNICINGCKELKSLLSQDNASETAAQHILTQI